MSISSIIPSTARVREILEMEGWFSLVRKSIQRIAICAKISFEYTRDFMMLPLVIHRLKSQRVTDISDLFDFATQCFSVIKPLQLREEILPFLELLKNRRPDSVLEIGTFTGGSLFLFTRIASDNAHIISVDLPGGVYGGGYAAWKIPLFKSFASRQQQINLIRANSHLDQTLLQVKSCLDSKAIDFLFIDGDHTYEGVRRDFEMYSPFVSPDGIIALHDIVPALANNGSGVHRFWIEVKKKYRHIEFVRDWKQGSCGIGVLFVEHHG